MVDNSSFAMTKLAKELKGNYYAPIPLKATRC